MTLERFLMSGRDSGRRTVVHVLWDGGLGGIQCIVKRVFLDMPDDQFRHCVILMENFGSIVNENDVAFSLGMRNGFDYVRFRRIFEVLDRIPDPIVNIHVDSPFARIFLPGRFPSILTQHGDILVRQRRKLVSRMLWRFACARVARVVCVSDYLRRRMEAESPNCASVARVIYNPLLAPCAKPRSLDTSRQLTIGFLGRLSQEKGIMDFIACAAELTRRSSNYRFRIIGDGPMRRRCADACAGAKITVDFAGQVGDVGPQLDKCDLLAIPSHAEGFSMATIEAMARGVAVVAYPTGGLPEIIDHGKTGLLSLTDTPAALADAVARLLTEKQMYDSVSAAGIRYVTAKFSADRYRSQWSDLFAFVAQERTRDHQQARH